MENFTLYQAIVLGKQINEIAITAKSKEFALNQFPIANTAEGLYSIGYFFTRQEAKQFIIDAYTEELARIQSDLNEAENL